MRTSARCIAPMVSDGAAAGALANLLPHGPIPHASREDRPRGVPGDRRRGGPPAPRRRADPVGELHLPRGARRARLGAHEQVRRGLSGPPLLRRAGVHRPGREPGARSREAGLPLRARQRAAALRLADEPGRVPRVHEAGRHDPRHGPLARRAPDARRARLAHGQDLQLRALQDGARERGRASTSTRCAKTALETRPKIVLCGYTSYPRDSTTRSSSRSRTRSARSRWPTSRTSAA